MSRSEQVWTFCVYAVVGFLLAAICWLAASELFASEPHASGGELLPHGLALFGAIPLGLAIHPRFRREIPPHWDKQPKLPRISGSHVCLMPPIPAAEAACGYSPEGVCSPAGCAYRNKQRHKLVSLLRTVRAMYPENTLWRIWLAEAGGGRVGLSIIVDGAGQRQVVGTLLPLEPTDATEAQSAIGLMAFEYADAAYIAANVVRDSLCNVSLARIANSAIGTDGEAHYTLTLEECAPRAKAGRHELPLEFPA